MKLKRIVQIMFVISVLFFICTSCNSKKSRNSDLDIDVGILDADSVEDADNELEEKDQAVDLDAIETDNDLIPDTENDDDLFIADDDYDNDDTQPDENDQVAVDNDIDEITDYEEIEETDDPKVICTGLDKCYDGSKETVCPNSTIDYFGQDYQYALKGYCFAKNFTSTEDLVTDNLTGLIWQRTLPDVYDGCTGSSGALCKWQEAVSYCENLTYADHNDWRLPTIEEYSTIVDYGKSGPSIDTAIFLNNSSKPYWSSTIRPDSINYAWIMDFVDGKVDFFDKSKQYYTRCVREGIPTNSKTYVESIENSEKIITDSETSLIWVGVSGKGKDWMSALKYCENLVYAGSADWRLPNINELKTLVTYSQTGPATLFPELYVYSYWSSTGYFDYNYHAWYLDFNSGKIHVQSKSSSYYVICVK